MGDTSLAYDSLEFGETMTNLTQNLLGKQIACLSLPQTVLFFFFLLQLLSDVLLSLIPVLAI